MDHAGLFLIEFLGDCGGEVTFQLLLFFGHVQLHGGLGDAAAQQHPYGDGAVHLDVGACQLAGLVRQAGDRNAIFSPIW